MPSLSGAAARLGSPLALGKAEGRVEGPGASPKSSGKSTIGTMLIMTGAKPLQAGCLEEFLFIVKTDPKAVEEIDAAKQVEPYAQALRETYNRHKFIPVKPDRHFMEVNRYLLSVTDTKSYFSSMSICQS